MQPDHSEHCVMPMQYRQKDCLPFQQTFPEERCLPFQQSTVCLFSRAHSAFRQTALCFSSSRIVGAGQVLTSCVQDALGLPSGARSVEEE